MKKSEIQTLITHQDIIRYLLIGNILPLITSINMLYFIHIINANTLEKTLLGLNQGLSIALGIFLAFFFHRLNIRVNQSFFIIFFFGAIACLIAPFIKNPYIFAILAVFMGLGFFSVQNLQPNLYKLYHKKHRAYYVMKGYRYMSISLIIMTMIYTFFLKDDSNTKIYVYIYLFCALSYLIIAFTSLKYPPVKVMKNKNTKITIKELWRTLINDRGFFILEMSWIFIGIGNLSIMPYRVNFLAEEQFHYQYSADIILILIVLVPETVKFIASYILPKLFDSFPFYIMRIITNLFFFSYILIFFLSGNFIVQLIASIFVGIAESMAHLNGTLFAHKIAKGDNVSLYMLIHRVSIALRAILAPLMGLYLLNVNLNILLAISLTSITLSSIMFSFSIKHLKGRT